MHDPQIYTLYEHTGEDRQNNRLGGPLSACNSGRRRFLLAASGMTLVAGLGSLAGCMRQSEPGLRIATNQWLGYELLYLAEEIVPDSQSGNGRIKLVELLSNSDSLQALAAGTVDGAGLTLDEALSARAAGLDLKIILVFDISAGADVLLARPGITQLDGIKGMRIGVEQTGVGALMLDSALKQANLKPTDVNIINLTADQHLTAIRNNKVDALVTFEPIASRILAGGGQRLFDSRAIPGSIVDVLAISNQALHTNPQTARNLISRYFQAMDYLHQHPSDAARRMAPRLGISPETLQAGYAGLKLPDLAENRRLLSGTPSPLEISSAKLAAVMLQQKLLARDVDVKNLIVANMLPEDQA